MMRGASTAFRRKFALSAPPLTFPARSPSSSVTSHRKVQRHCRVLPFYCAARLLNSGPQRDRGIQSTGRRRRRRISFLTDVEGDGMYFDRYIENSRIVGFRSVRPNIDQTSLDFFPYKKEVVFLEDTAEDLLIFGGDVGDKGGSDLYVLRQLLSLSRRYPDRTHFLMGNRDINKMRIVPELGPIGQEALPYHGGVWWLKGTGLVGDPCKDLSGAHQQGSETKSKVPSNSPAERLKWILGKTMGSPDAFELRRGELERERHFVSQALGKHRENDRGKSIAPISDEEVVLSYRKSCSPKCGEVGRFLSKAKLAIKLGGVMFMHGALPLTPEVLAKAEDRDSNNGTTLWSNFAFAMPWDKSLGGKVSNVHDWIGHLNSFAHDQVRIWEQSLQSFDPNKRMWSTKIWSTNGGYTVADGHEYGSLLQYGMGWTPDKKRNPTIVYSSWLNDGMPQRFYENKEDCSEGSTDGGDGESEGRTNTAYADAVRSFFQAARLQLIVTGHQPHGDLPVPVKISPTPTRDSESEGARYIVVCDTSYSGDTHWINGGSGESRNNQGRGGGASGRGDVAVSELLIEQCAVGGTILGVTCHGKLSDASKYESIDLYDSESDPDASLVGTLVDRKDFVFEGSVRDDSNEETPWWVKTKMTNGDFIVSTGKGYDIWNSVAKKRQQ